MARWTCPRCDREFGRAHQSHTCVPGCTPEQSFRGRPAVQYDIYRELLDHVQGLGPVHVDAVAVGVFLKSDRKFVEIRPMARALSVEIVLPYRLDDPRVVRTMPMGPGRVVNVARLSTVDQIDDEVRGWFTDAYAEATDE